MCRCKQVKKSDVHLRPGSDARPFSSFPCDYGEFLSILWDFLGTFAPVGPFIIAMTDKTCTIWMQRQVAVSEQDNEHSDLIERACSDPNAFAELYLRHYRDVFRYCVRRLFDRHLAEDATSTVFFKVMNGLDSFGGNTAGFRSWLLRIATNVANDHLREARRRAALVQRAVVNARENVASARDGDDDLAERKACLRQALLSLKPRYQAVITLRFFENMKLTEIAACLGESPSTVRTRLSRATTKLRQKLNSVGSDRGCRL